MRSLLFLFFIVPILTWNVGISNFLEEISSLSHSVVFLCFFAVFVKDDLLISPCYSLELCIQLSIFFPFLLCLSLLLFTQLFVKLPQTTPLPSCISFSLGWFWSPPPVQCYKLPSVVLQAVLSIRSNHKGFDLDHTWMAYWFSLLSLIWAWFLQHRADDLSHSHLQVLFLLTI